MMHISDDVTFDRAHWPGRAPPLNTFSHRIVSRGAGAYYYD